MTMKLFLGLALTVLVTNVLSDNSCTVECPEYCGGVVECKMVTEMLPETSCGKEMRICEDECQQKCSCEDECSKSCRLLAQKCLDEAKECQNEEDCITSCKSNC